MSIQYSNFVFVTCICFSPQVQFYVELYALIRLSCLTEFDEVTGYHHNEETYISCNLYNWRCISNRGMFLNIVLRYSRIICFLDLREKRR